jgi:hypothetical protein
VVYNPEQQKIKYLVEIERAEGRRAEEGEGMGEEEPEDRINVETEIRSAPDVRIFIH